MDRWGWQYGSKRLGMVYWTQHMRANQIEFATRSRWTSKNDILIRFMIFACRHVATCIPLAFSASDRTFQTMLSTVTAFWIAVWLTSEIYRF
jgi:hypothetical protein